MKKVFFLVFVAVALLVGFNLIFNLRRFFIWPDVSVFDVDFWFSLIVVMFYGGFFLLTKKVFGKISFGNLPLILWSFVKIIPRFFKQVFPVLRKLWIEQLSNGE